MNNLLLDEIAWINANANRYKSEIHKDSVIGNITKRYRIKELETAIKRFHENPITANKFEMTDLVSSQ